ncbi:hypothetical protein BH24ACT15_BH24ACT15_32360 [soil metagenome]|jgi:CBS domain-containing protein
MTALHEFMTAEVKTISEGAEVAEAAEVMVRGRFGSVVIVSGTTLMGIFTERDVLRCAAARQDLTTARVRDWMTPDPVTASPDTDSSDAAQTMMSQGFRHLPVVADNRLIGIVSLRDVLGARIGLDP